MNQKQIPEKFAYGIDALGDYCCPAQAAGYAPDTGDDSCIPAENYDQSVRTLELSDDSHLVSAEDAEVAWLHAIGRMEDGEHISPKELRVAREIATELGWL